MKRNEMKEIVTKLKTFELIKNIYKNKNLYNFKSVIKAADLLNLILIFFLTIHAFLKSIIYSLKPECHESKKLEVVF